MLYQSSTVNYNTSTKVNKRSEYIIKNTTSFETPKDILVKEPEYKKLNKILKELNIEL